MPDRRGLRRAEEGHRLKPVPTLVSDWGLAEAVPERRRLPHVRQVPADRAAEKEHEASRKMPRHS